MKTSLVKLTYVDDDGSETILSFQPHQELELIKVLNSLFTENRVYTDSRVTKVTAGSGTYTFVRGVEVI